MTITTYTDREIALQKRVAELEKELSDTDIALEECKMDWSGDVNQIKAEHKHELALEKQLAQLNGEIAAELKADKLRLEAERDEYQQAADKMATEHKVERDTLRQQLAEAQALIEASRKQEAVARFDWGLGKFEWLTKYSYDKHHRVPLYAAPVVADDVLKDAQRYRWFRDNSSSISWNPSRFNAEIVSGLSHAGTGYLGFNFEDAIDAAIGGAND